MELDGVDVGVSAARAWEIVRHGDLARSPLVRALFAVRALPARITGSEVEPTALAIDDIGGHDRRGFRILGEETGAEVVLGAIGKVWHLDIPFVRVEDAAQFRAFREPDYAKVAWALRVLPRGDDAARIEVEVRVDATDDASWKRFRRYFRFIGPGSHFIRRTLLAAYARELGTPDAREDERPLPGDARIGDARAQLTHGITIRARPDQVWPWLIQMGARRAGFYSVDLLDNANVPSARELHAELQHLEVGEVIPATADGDEGFEVLELEAPTALVLGTLFDSQQQRQLPFAAARPSRFWQTTWAFALEPLDPEHTRLHVRARAAFAGQSLHAMWIRPVHHLMQTAQLENLAARVEGRVPRDGWRDVIAGIGGAAAMALNLLTPFLRGARSHYGVDAETAAGTFPGDDRIPEPRWSWTHGIEIDAPPEAVWPWVAQIGADRGGFYSYQWLENLVGCELRNADAIHPEWALREGDTLCLHPTASGLPIVALEPGRYLLGHDAPDPTAVASGQPWVTVTWLFHLEPLDGGGTRLISRFRSDCSDDLATRLRTGPYLTESIGFVMDRQMLKGIEQRVRRRAREALTTDAPLRS